MRRVEWQEVWYMESPSGTDCLWCFVSKFSMFFSNTNCFLRASSSYGLVSVFCKKYNEGVRV